MTSVDVRKIRTCSLKNRKSKVRQKDFARACPKGSSFARFARSLPNILAGKDFTRLVTAVITAHKKKKPVIFMLGAHVIKCGLSPIITSLISRNIITAIALNGAGIIHDTEIAMVGRTSEDVGAAVSKGSFGMARETAAFVNQAITQGLDKGLGIGPGLGEAISRAKLPHRDLSITATAYKYKVPVSVHVAIGTDIIHQHPSCDGRDTGEGSLLDFRRLIDTVAKLGNGGVVINFGSAVLLPEVFLKALNVARNLGYKVKNFTAANFDMLMQYRPNENVVTRPTREGGWGCNITGHHEIMLPLFHQAIIEKL